MTQETDLASFAKMCADRPLHHNASRLQSVHYLVDEADGSLLHAALPPADGASEGGSLSIRSVIVCKSVHTMFDNRCIDAPEYVLQKYCVFLSHDLDSLVFAEEDTDEEREQEAGDVDDDEDKENERPSRRCEPY